MDGAIALPQPTLRDVPVGMWLALGLLALIVIAIGYDQGSLLRLFLGELAEKNNYLHEFFHDGRHLLGFPCH